jgi:hypothetical protein
MKSAPEDTRSADTNSRSPHRPRPTNREAPWSDRTEATSARKDKRTAHEERRPDRTDCRIDHRAEEIPELASRFLSNFGTLALEFGQARLLGPENGCSSLRDRRPRDRHGLGYTPRIGQNLGKGSAIPFPLVALQERPTTILSERSRH